MDTRSFCNVPCSHGGICTLDIDHDGLHSASGYCEWERSEDDPIQSDRDASAGMALDALSLNLKETFGLMLEEEE